MKVAIVHDWLTGLRGGERCLLAFLKLYPDADIFTLLHVPGTTTEEIDSRIKQSSFISFLPKAASYYRYLLPFYPLAARQLDLREYDLVISLSHAAAKNVRINKESKHICYCFTPMRYIWDQAGSYFGKLTPFLWPVIKVLRIWDKRGSQGVDQFVAISRFIAARIRCYYKREAEVIFPPVATGWISPLESYEKGAAFLYAGALVPYKRPDLVVKAFNRLDEELWIVGSGPEEEYLRTIASGNIKFFGKVSDAKLAEAYRRCRALIFPGKEDFGMIPVECMAAGRPVIARQAGGASETVLGVMPVQGAVESDKATGVFFSNDSEQEEDLLFEAIKYFIANEECFKPENCIKQAQKFSFERFKEDWIKVSGPSISELYEQGEYAKAKTAAL